MSLIRKYSYSMQPTVMNVYIVQVKNNIKKSFHWRICFWEKEKTKIYSGPHLSIHLRPIWAVGLGTVKHQPCCNYIKKQQMWCVCKLRQFVWPMKIKKKKSGETSLHWANWLANLLQVGFHIRYDENMIIFGLLFYGPKIIWRLGRNQKGNIHCTCSPW